MSGRRQLLRDVLLPGAVSGAVGWAVTSALAALVFLVLAKDAGRPFEWFATVFHRGARPQGGEFVVLGLLVHFAVCGGVATAFALRLPRGGTAAAAVGLAPLYMLLVHVTLCVFVIPYVAPPLARTPFFVASLPLSLSFGFALPIIVPLRRRFAQLSGVVSAALRVSELLDGDGASLSAAKTTLREAKRRLDPGA
jgi:hypothetical protein